MVLMNLLEDRGTDVENRFFSAAGEGGRDKLRE